MLASIDALRHESRGLSHAPSPDNDPGDMPPLERIPHSDSDDSDDSDMPYLQSVSNTSEDDDDDDDDDDMLDSEGLDSDGEIWPWQRQLLRLGSNNTNNRPRAPHRRRGGGNTNRNPARGTRPAVTSVGNISSSPLNEDAVFYPTSTMTETPSVPPVTSTSTPASPTTTTTATRSDPTSQGIFPCITITGDTTASSSSPSPSPSPPGKFEVVEAEASSSRTSTPSMVAEPPFVTDGRGRVVWTSSSDEVSPSSSAVETRSQSPIDGNLGAGLIDGGNDGTQSVASTEEGGVNGGRRSGGGGSTLFDWFSSLF